MKEVYQDTGNEPSVNNVKEDQMKLLGHIDFSGLTTKERTLVQQMLIEDVDVFSVNDTDIDKFS